MKIIRVFTRRTMATPVDDLAFIGDPGLFVPKDADEVRVSVTFTYDRAEGERLYKAWNELYPGIVRIGGPAFDMPGQDFVPGVYLKKGYVITSRGCDNCCWFCYVWRREGRTIRELPITDGYNILDDNLLACSDDHIRAVFAMLKRQPRQPIFSGGLEAKKLKPWQADELRKLNPESMFFAYDTADDFEPLVEAARLMPWALDHRRLAVYVLIGYSNDTIDQAEKRLKAVYGLGMLPHAMLYRNDSGPQDLRKWRTFTRLWSRRASVQAMMKDGGNE